MDRLYEYAVILQPKPDTDEKSEIVVPVTTVLAPSEGQVNLIAARKIPDDLTDRLDRIQVVVRPF